jgi:hypothetical protein
MKARTGREHVETSQKSDPPKKSSRVGWLFLRIMMPRNHRSRRAPASEIELVVIRWRLLGEMDELETL